MSDRQHTDTEVFETAERLWAAARSRDEESIAISHYLQACDKNDARAYLSLFKINSCWRHSYSITGRQHDGINYLRNALELRYVPAFLFAGGLEELSVYTRLTCLAIGLEIAVCNDDPSVFLFEQEHSRLSENFSAELASETRSIAKNWVPGSDVLIQRSPRDGQTIVHPQRYDREQDRPRPGWAIYPKLPNLNAYLELLPGADEYRLGHDCLEEGENESFIRHLVAAASRGNGQAMYALREYSFDFSLLDAAKHGSPDAFNDLLNSISSSLWDNPLTNTSHAQFSGRPEVMRRLKCMLYLYSLMERLGIERHTDSVIAVTLDSDTDSGYRDWPVAMSVVKYSLFGHDEVREINDLAYLWDFGGNFHSEIF